ncbi:MAG: ABC transporter substrate-binding protein [Lachnospiraceae bacterium]|nr:ABC transporter substrate-binding protein [Lachnospiraceae bacterium]
MKKRFALLAAACLCMAVSMTSFAADKTDIVVAMDADVDTLHPTDFSTTVELGVLNQIYDTLLYYSPDGTKDPEPRIAESYEISDDGLDYTFHLRDDVTFHDGTPVTADDVVFSIELYKASEYQGSQISMLSSVEATDEHTVVCHLDAPYSPFLQGICSPMIASKAYYESSEDDFVNNPIGSGPYKFVSRAKGSNIKLEANEDYYRGAPEIKEVTFEVIPDSSTKAIALQTGEVNFAEIDSATKPQLEANPAITIAEVPTSSFSYIAMNTEKEPFDDARVRQAINYAIDRDNLVAVCYDGEAEVNSNICAKERFGYSDDQFQYTYDPEKAKELLAEAGIETPYDLGEILVAEKYSNLATVIQNDLKAVGLDVTISVKEFNSYISDLQNGSYGITALNMTLEGDTQTLEMAFTSDYIGIANNARYSDEEMDKLFGQARTETDNDKRAEVFNEIFTKAQDEAIYAVMCNPMTLYAYNSDLTCPEFVLEGNYYLYDFSWAE